MSRFHISSPVRNHDTFHHKQQLFRQQHYIRGDLSDLISPAQSSQVWESFRASWENLVPDQYMGDGGHYRQRRYSVFDYDIKTAEVQVNHDQRHYQALDYNTLNGGIYREYPAFDKQFLGNSLFQSVLGKAMQMVGEVDSDTRHWRIEGHQFRILASTEESGKPTPEGIHKDGRDYVFIVMVDRKAIKGGKSRVYSQDGKSLAQRRMRKPLEYLFIDDRKLLHYVTPIKPLLMDQVGHRDVLVLTFRKSDI